MKYIIKYKIENPMNVLYGIGYMEKRGEEFLKEYRNEEFDRISKNIIEKI